MAAVRSLKDSVAIVTGASGGIGIAVAEELAKAGCKAVGVVGRSADRLKEVAAKVEATGAKAVVIEADVTTKDGCKTAVDAIVKECGGLNILVNNAGTGKPGNFETLDVDDFQPVVDCNLMAVLHMSKFAYPHLKEKAMEIPSAIVNISSIAGIMTMENMTTYCASKHGVNGLTGSLFDDIRKHGIKVSCINPGMVNTPMTDAFKGADKTKMIQPVDVAHAVNFICTFPSQGCPTDITIRPQFPVFS